VFLLRIIKNLYAKFSKRKDEESNRKTQLFKSTFVVINGFNKTLQKKYASKDIQERDIKRMRAVLTFAGNILVKKHSI
jgi:hypothetical protein